MYRMPSSRRKVKKNEKVNLVPILDAVFILIFFLVMSATFLKINEIGSNVPIISNKQPPPPKKKPLALHLTIYGEKLVLGAGIPTRTIKSFGKVEVTNKDGEVEKKYDLNSLHDYLIGIKKKNIKEKDIVFEPIANIEYEEIISIMDAVRIFKDTDEEIYDKDKDGLDMKLEELFAQITFSNLMD